MTTLKEIILSFNLFFPMKLIHFNKRKKKLSLETGFIIACVAIENATFLHF